MSSPSTGKLCEEGCLQDFHKSSWEGRCYLGGTCCPPRLYFLLKMKQFALKLCSSISGGDFAQLALVPSSADSTLLTLGKRGERGCGAIKPWERGREVMTPRGSRVSLAPTKCSMAEASCLAPPSDQIQLMIREQLNGWDHPTESFVQSNVWRPWRGWSFTSEMMSKCH